MGNKDILDSSQRAIRFPDFFIIGAPKAGTTALSEYLKRHPEIGFSEPKEPHYFNDDFSSRYASSIVEYMKCFSDVCRSRRVVGEGSVFYLKSKTAVPNILKHAPDAKFIVMLRSPVDAVYSWHRQALYSFGEDIGDFEQAWLAQAAREQGDRIPRHNVVREALQYGPLFKYGEQLKRLFDHVRRERVLVLLFQDLKSNADHVFRRTLSFLELPNVALGAYEVWNASKIPRSMLLEGAMQRLGSAKRAIGIEKGYGLLTKLKQWNTRYQNAVPMSSSLRRTLTEYYFEDVQQVGKLIGRDLGDWLHE